MDKRPIARFFQSLFAGFTGQTLEEFNVASMERKRDAITRLFDSPSPQNHEVAARTLCNMGNEGFAFMGNLRSMLQEPDNETSKGLQWAVQAISNQELDGVMALGDVAPLCLYWKDKTPLHEVVGVVQKSIATLEHLASLVVAGNQPQLTGYVEDAIPFIASAFCHPIPESALSALHAFEKLSTAAIKAGHEPLRTAFEVHIPNVKKCCNAHGNAGVRKKAEEIYTSLSHVSLETFGRPDSNRGSLEPKRFE